MPDLENGVQEMPEAGRRTPPRRTQRQAPRQALQAQAIHGSVLMRLINDVTARSAERDTLDLTIRERLMIQRLGLDGAMPIAALGQHLSVSSSSMTGLVDHLEAKGHIARRPHPTDRRAIDLVLTRKGRSAFDREVGFYRTLVDETLLPLGPDAMNLVLRALSALN